MGQSQPITNFDLSPYLFENNLYLFGEGRIALGNDGKTGGSLGAGARYFFPRTNTILGASGWLDIDATRGPTFRQWGINAEMLSEFLDIRGNLYVPYGQIQKVTSVRLEEGSQHFTDRPLGDVLPGEAQGTYLSFQRRIFSSTALQGFDTLFTIPLPGEFAQTLNLEASAGFYGYEANDGSVDQTYGWRVRFDIDLFERLSHMFLEINRDQAFKTNVAFGADINYWHKLEHRPRLGHSQYNRLAEWVRRNRTTVALDSSALGASEMAINPVTNRPYVIYQVAQTDEVSHGGDGTLGNPFQNLQDAINATGTSDALRPSDFVQYVHGNSVIENGIDIGPGLDGVRIIGEQIIPVVGLPVQGLGTNITLPLVTAVPFDTPIIQNVTGMNAVTLNSNNATFAGFDIFNITGGDAIFAGPGIVGGNIQSVNITTVNTGNGLNFNGAAGTFNVQDVVIKDIEGDAVKVTAGTANIIFTGQNSAIDNTTNSHAAHGYALNVEDAAGSVNLSGTTISDTGGSGVRVYGTTPGSSTARVTLGPTTLTDTVVAGPTGTEIATGAVYVRNHAGTVTFNDVLNINGIDAVLGGNSLVVEALQTQGSVFASKAVNISNRRGHGVYVVNSADTASTTNLGNNNVIFQQQVSITAPGAGYVGDEAGVLYQSYSGGLRFDGGLSIDGGLGDGVEVTGGLGIPQGNSRGQFVAQNVRISNISGAGGVSGISFNVHDIDKQNFVVNTNGIMVSDRGTAGSTGDFGKGISITDFDGQALFQGVTTVSNALGSEAIGIDVETHSTTGTVGFQQTNVNDQLGVGSYGVRIFDNLESISGVSFTSLNVTSTDATAVSIQDNALVSVNGGTLNATDARAIEIFTTPFSTLTQSHRVSLTAVSASNSDYGIFVSESEGQFSVVGQGGAGGTGGTISDMTVAGAHFDNTQGADLNFMRFSNNQRGVEGLSMVSTTTSRNTPLLRIGGSTIEGSAAEGIYAQDVVNFNLQSTVLNGNGVTDSQEQVELFTATNIGAVGAVFNDNSITDSLTTAITGTDLIYIHNAAGLNSTSTLNLIMTNNGSPGSTVNLNSITANRGDGDAAINVTWAGGQATALFDSNQINLSNGDGQIGLNLSTSSLATINYTNNAMSSQGIDAIGIQGIFQQRTIFNASDNQGFDIDGNLVSGSGFLMAGLSSTGMNLQFLATGNTITVNNNLMEFTQLGSQGIVFQRLTGNNDTSLAIGGNSIYRPGPGGLITILPTVGIYIQSVNGNVNLVNSGDNFVQISGSFPAFQYYDFLMTNPNAANGTKILVNGTLVP